MVNSAPLAVDIEDALADLAAVCSFPSCRNEATWIARGHRPCSHPVLACDPCQARTHADFARLVPFPCAKCGFTPQTANEACNWRRL